MGTRSRFVLSRRRRRRRRVVGVCGVVSIASRDRLDYYFICFHVVTAGHLGFYVIKLQFYLFDVSLLVMIISVI